MVLGQADRSTQPRLSTVLDNTLSSYDTPTVLDLFNLNWAFLIILN
jgi:hypothetical protein